MKTKRYLLAVAAAMLCCACQEKVEEAITFVEIQPSAILFQSPADEQTITFASTGDWSVTNDADWITVTPSSGKGSASIVTVTVSVNENSGNDRTGTVTFKSGNVSRALDVLQKKELAKWAVVKYDGTNWLKSDYFTMEVDGDYMVAGNVPLAAGSQFAFVYNDSWLNPDACGYDRVIGGPGSVDSNLSIPATYEKFFIPTEGGNYDIYLSNDLSTVFFMKAGTPVTEAAEYVEPEFVWGINGKVVPGGLDVTMVKENNYLVAKDVTFSEVNFKIRGNGEWNDESDLGLAEAGEYELHTAIPVVTSKANKAEGKGEVKSITVAADGNTSYDVYLDLENMQVWVLVPGYLPGDKKPAIDKTLASWEIATGAAYTSTFGTTAGILDTSAGDGGCYVDANKEGTGRITYVQVDKTGLTNSTQAKRMVASDGSPCVYGTSTGDYWLFETGAGTQLKAGNIVTISFQIRVQSSGLAYWRAEYFNGTEWVPARATTNGTVDTENFDYTHFLNSGAFTDIMETVTIPADMDGFKFRLLCVSQVDTAGKIVDGASKKTVKIGGAPTITLTK